MLDVSMELPRVNEQYRQRGFRYSYGISNHRGSRVPYDSVVKVDTLRRDWLVYQRPNCMPGEAIFVGRPGAQDEDDGVLLTVMLDCQRHVSYLAVLDARTMVEMGSAQAPAIIPFGFHGAYLPLDQDQQDQDQDDTNDNDDNDNDNDDNDHDHDHNDNNDHNNDRGSDFDGAAD